jgi:hypothetical protein
MVAAACGADDGIGDTGVVTTEPDTTGGTTAAPDVTPAPSVPPTTAGTTRADTTQPDDTQPGTAVPAPEVLTESDEGRFVLGAEPVSLRLSSDWSWDAPTVDGTGVVLTPGDYLVDPGYVEWLVEAAGAGSATLTVAGTPNCGDAVTCPERIVTFELDVTG